MLGFRSPEQMLLDQSDGDWSPRAWSREIENVTWGALHGRNSRFPELQFQMAANLLSLVIRVLNNENSPVA